MMKEHPAEGRKLIESLPKIEFGNFNEIAEQMGVTEEFIRKAWEYYAETEWLRDNR